MVTRPVPTPRAEARSTSTIRLSIVVHKSTRSNIVNEKTACTILNDVLDSRKKYEYDEKRNHVKTITTTYDPDGSMTGYTEYVYDEDGTTISVTEFDKDGCRIIHDDY